ncbi:uncharacterized protein OCT59_003670 [Rhizophagus irregularis]|uniref:uncharacterized protein n=1 Tax=Rhizophagus irregularis TaxID=588596 RepID=UPI001A02E226|nr:hypothetical protein OCT59_003670 [Rhizophagus irregularis]GBC17635.2 hypothetical protein RIR_jg28513.t1 [Rhizophagus irregularis DAOM 181602=DAOM 197198]
MFVFVIIALNFSNNCFIIGRSIRNKVFSETLRNFYSLTLLQHCRHRGLFQITLNVWMMTQFFLTTQNRPPLLCFYEPTYYQNANKLPNQRCMIPSLCKQ